MTDCILTSIIRHLEFLKVSPHGVEVILPGLPSLTDCCQESAKYKSTDLLKVIPYKKDCKILPEVRDIYEIIKQQSGHQPNDSAFAGVVPLISILIASLYDLECIVEQDKDFDFEAQANDLEKRFLVGLNIKPIGEGVGIYCGYFKSHAIFWPEKSMPEDDLWVMSIKFRRY